MVMKMNIIISNSSGQPIYEQIVSQIKSMIISGQLKEGEALPSMRLLAKELRISVITTKRAYDELEREGFIVSFTGKGSFVAGKNLELIKEQLLKEIEDHMQEIVKLSKDCGLKMCIRDRERYGERIYSRLHGKGKGENNGCLWSSPKSCLIGQKSFYRPVREKYAIQ